MNDIQDVTVTNMDKSMYVKPLRMKFTQNGRKRTWDVLEVHDSVVILIFNTTKKAFIFVKQFRPAVYLCRSERRTAEDGSEGIDSTQYPGSLGVTHELCAGIVDKDKELKVIAQEEVLEECGYSVPLEKMTRVIGYRSNVGASGSFQTLFYAEVTDDMKVSAGGGLHEEGEMIDVVEVSLEEGRQFIMDESIIKPVAMMFALMWFYENKAKNFIS